MTMAEWACRGLMGLGPTTHAEAITPADAGPAWSSTKSLPDLVGDHPANPTTCLVEAKGHRKLMRPKLVKGAQQLSNAECLDWTLIWNRPYLQWVLTTYLQHYYTARPHRGINLQAPIPARQGLEMSTRPDSAGVPEAAR